MNNHIRKYINEYLNDQLKNRWYLDRNAAADLHHQGKGIIVTVDILIPNSYYIIVETKAI